MSSSRVRDLNNNNTGMSFTGMGFTGSGGFRVRDLNNNNTGMGFTGMGFARSGGFREALHLRKVLETTLKSSTQQQSGSTQAAVMATEIEIPEDFANKLFGQSWPMLLIQEIRKYRQMFSSNFDRYYEMGTDFLYYLRVGGFFVIAACGCCVGIYVSKRIWSWFSQESTPTSTPTSAESFKNLIQSFVRKGELTKAEYTLDRMIGRGYIPDPDLFEALLGKLLEDFNVSLASKVLKSMSELRVVGDTDLVANVLKSLLLRGQVVEAIQQLELLIEIGVIPSFPNLIDYLCGEHKSIAAWKILEFGFVRNCAMDERISCKVFDSLLSTEYALAGYSLLVRCYIRNCDRARLDYLVEMLNLQGYGQEAHIISTMWGNSS